jgi:FKBP-type peptidyl-prolyl cis-trans isomerase 2
MSEGALPQDYRIAEASSYVKIRYKTRIPGGPVLKGAGEPEVMDFVTGYLQVIPGLEKRLVGGAVGEKHSFTVPPEEAFGEFREELLIEKSKEDFHFPAGMKPYPGMELPLVTRGADGPDTVMIRAIKEETIVIDLNHPMAGKSLQYELEIVEARPAKESDVCGEWDKQKTDQACCPAIPEIILGEDPPREH